MKLIHISDLHIGKRVKNFSMAEEQQDILEQILRIIEEEKADAVLIAGDIYDKQTPSAKAIEMLDDFLVKLAKLDAQTFIISGNHDSSEQIAYARKLIDVSGVHMSPVYDGHVEPFVLQDEQGPVNFYLLPFIKPLVVKHCFPEEEIADYTDAVRCAIKHMNVDPSARNVIISHQFVVGASRCESEISVGGLDSVDGSVFEDFDYVALGHIHTPQNVRKEKIRYCGTPLKYSFDEVDQKKSVTIVELGTKGEVSISTRELKPLRDFVRITDQFDNIVETYRNRNNEDYTEVILLDEQEIPEAFAKLQIIFPNLMSLKYDFIRARINREFTEIPTEVELSELDMIGLLFKRMNDRDMSEEQIKYLEEVILRVKGEA